MTIPNSIRNADRETLEKLAWGWYQMVCELERKINCKSVGRVEVIDENGRSYVKHLTKDQHAWFNFQDDNQTLKVFIERDACCEGGPMTAGCLHDNCKGPLDEKNNTRVEVKPNRGSKMKFEEWWAEKDRVYANEYSTFKSVAAEAWYCQQKRIDDQELHINRLNTEIRELEDSLSSSEHIKKILNRCVDEWIEKTEWVQKEADYKYLGMHRADILTLWVKEARKERKRVKKRLVTYIMETNCSIGYSAAKKLAKDLLNPK